MNASMSTAVDAAGDRVAWRWWLGAAVTGIAVAVLAPLTDLEALRDGLRAAVAAPLGAVAALAAYGTAFALRALAWTRLQPQVGFGQALSAVHVGLGANHLLPLRLGELARPAAVIRRTGAPAGRTGAVTVALRAADVLTLLAVALVAGPSVVAAAGFWAPLAGGGAVVALAGAVWWLRRAGHPAPGPGVLALAAAAWPLEALVVQLAAGWAGLDLDLPAAILVGAMAVLAQVAAVAPGGFGTYEAGGVAALAALGHDPRAALTAVLLAHGVKTVYALATGAVAVAVPAPTLLGRLRLPRRTPPVPPRPLPAGPVWLLLPAHDEEATVADVIARVPAQVAGRPVRCAVVDDGSRDGTAEAARGARVIRHHRNRGLGAAVRTGLSAAVADGAAAVVFCDADGEYAPEEMGRLLEPLLEGRADYVVGNRFAGRIRRMRPHRRLGNRVLTAALSVVARRRLGDGQSGYRALSRRAAQHAEIVHDYNYAQVLTLDLLGKGYTYAEVPISYGFRQCGRSFVRLGAYLRAVVPAVHAELNGG